MRLIRNKCQQTLQNTSSHGYFQKFLGYCLSEHSKARKDWTFFLNIEIKIII
jgi:hypothetical protein